LADGRNLAQAKNSEDGKNLAHAKNLADGKNLAHAKKFGGSYCKSLAHAKNSADGKNLTHAKNLAPPKSLAPVKISASLEMLAQQETPSCLGSAESATADFSLVLLMSMLSSLVMLNRVHVVSK
jgi:hypothetical protein